MLLLLEGARRGDEGSLDPHNRQKRRHVSDLSRVVVDVDGATDVMERRAHHDVFFTENTDRHAHRHIVSQSEH